MDAEVCPAPAFLQAQTSALVVLRPTTGSDRPSLPPFEGALLPIKNTRSRTGRLARAPGGNMNTLTSAACMSRAAFAVSKAVL